MPPRKAPKSATPAAPLPSPNTSHPCYSPLAAVLADLPTRPHSPSYHVFFEPTPGSSTTRKSSTPPPKKKQKKTEEVLSPVEGAWEAERVQKKLLKWFDEKREERKMPWRKDVVPSEMTKKERSQRGYEVSRFSSFKAVECFSGKTDEIKPLAFGRSGLARSCFNRLK